VAAEPIGNKISVTKPLLLFGRSLQLKFKLFVCSPATYPNHDGTKIAGLIFQN
jgi:hypothetical protein